MTNNFSKYEFDCKCGCEMPDSVFENVKKVAQQLQKVRDIIFEPIKINSGYRCPSHNKAVGGASRSQHLLGTASDIVVSQYNPNETYGLLDSFMGKEILQGGLGSYNTFTHYDIRGNKARW